MLDFEFDMGFDFEIVTLKHALAADIEELLKKFKGIRIGGSIEEATSKPPTGKEGNTEGVGMEASNGYFLLGFLFFADDRSNSIIVGGKVSDVALAKARIKDLDIPVDYASDLIPLRFATAEDVVKFGINSLMKLIRGQKIHSQLRLRNPHQLLAVVKLKIVVVINYPVVLQLPQIQGRILVFVSGTSYDVELAREKIKLLDKSLPMAQIDTIFVMVTLTGNTSRGIDLFSNAIYQKSEGGTFTDPQTQESRLIPEGENLSFNANLPGFCWANYFWFLRFEIKQCGL